MWLPMTLLIPLLLSPCSLLSAYGAGSLPAGERVSALAASIVADQGRMEQGPYDDIAPARGAPDVKMSAGETAVIPGYCRKSWMLKVRRWVRP